MTIETICDQVLIVDAHTHIYDCFSLTDFLNSATQNFSDIAKEKRVDLPHSSILLLTETSRDHYFKTLKEGVQSGQLSVSGWQFQCTDEACSLYAVNQELGGIFIIAGSQVVSSEDLEVLALMTDYRWPDGLPFEQIINEVIQQGGVPVIPWGFGKWIGRRGTIVGKVLEQSDDGRLFLGDNSGRPAFWSYSPIFEQARKKGIPILPGTDPLPFSREASRAGRYGFSVSGQFDGKRPAESLKRILTQANQRPAPYGELENPFQFVRNQIEMQLVKRRRNAQ
jgi:hypothetical protein